MIQKALTLMNENYYMILACLCMFGGQGCVWFSSNSQIVWSWWSGKPLLAAMVFGIPASLFFWHGTKYGFMAMDELWGPRFLAFGMSYLTFPLLTWWLANESMFTAKTMICVLLSFTIMGIQIFWE
jgi:hypothetical protein